ncbi:MAG: hypothetical protein HY017_05515 [Betaproteobacteria bacterium]|nr:hypothetical protein [Betaproteobacteria bacterium]
MSADRIEGKWIELFAEIVLARLGAWPFCIVVPTRRQSTPEAASVPGMVDA